MFEHFFQLLIPFLYSSTLILSPHHYENLYLFDIGSQSIITDSLLDIKSTNYDKSNLHWRGVKIDPYTSQLYASNSKSDYSFVGIWKCSNSYPLDFTSFFTQESDSNNNGLDHPYEIFLYPDNTTTSNISSDGLYVSTQNTQSVLLYNNLGTPDTITNAEYPGAIITYDEFIGDDNGVRGITIDLDMNLLFVAMESYNSVLVYNIEDIENTKNVYNISFADTFGAVGVMISDGMLYIGNKDNDTVYACKYSSTECKLVWNTDSKNNGGLNHPAGITIDKFSGILYVISQNTDSILRFNATNGDYIDLFYDYSDEDIDGENILFDDSGCGTGQEKWHKSHQNMFGQVKK